MATTLIVHVRFTFHQYHNGYQDNMQGGRGLVSAGGSQKHLIYNDDCLSLRGPISGHCHFRLICHGGRCGWGRGALSCFYC